MIGTRGLAGSFWSGWRPWRRWVPPSTSSPERLTAVVGPLDYASSRASVTIFQGPKVSFPVKA